MPGYILHLTEAQIVCRILEKNGVRLTPEWKNRFFLGTLLPDTKRKTDKVTSHFWNPAHLDRLAIPPDMELFGTKYGQSIDTPVMMGYRMHLQLDAAYVEQFWDSILEFRDEAGHTAELKKDIRAVWLKTFQKEVMVDDFFSHAYYYGDYSRMNAYLLKKYQIEVPQYEAGLDCPVTEADMDGLKLVLDELRALQADAALGEERHLTVFSMKDLEAFIEEQAAVAADQIRKEL